MAETDFYIKKNPPSKPITVRSSVVIRLPLFSYGEVGPANNEYPSFQNLYQNFNAEDFAKVLTGGALNKAIKYALLYNYFGFPVANIKATDDQNDYKQGSLQFSSQNNYHLKYQDFYYNYQDKLVHYSTDDNSSLGAISNISVSSREFYQYGYLKQLPDFSEFMDPFDYFNVGEPEQQNDFSFQSIQDELNFNTGLETDFVKDIYLCLHGSDSGDHSSQNIGGFNSFVEPIGISARGSLMYSHYAGPNLRLMAFNIYHEAGNTTGGYFNGKEKVSPGGEHPAASTQELIDQTDYLELMGSWDSLYNPIDRTYSRAWMPTSPPQNYKSLLHTLPEVALIEFDQDGLGLETSVMNEFSYYQDTSFFGTNPNQDGTWRQSFNELYGGEDIDSLALFLKPYMVGKWYETYEGFGSQITEDKYVESFSINNIASMYKLAPQEPGLLDQDYGGSVINYFLEDPARTLNSIYPKIFKYVTDIVPTAPLPSTLHNQSAGNVTIIDPNKTSGQLELSDVLRKFRLSADSYVVEEYYNTPKRTSLGFTHRIGDNGSSGKDLINIAKEEVELDPQSLEARNKFFVVTKTESQRKYLMQNKPEGADPFGGSSWGSNSLTNDPNFGVSVFASPLAKNLLSDANDVFDGGFPNESLGYDTGQELDELQKTYKFSDYLLSSLYFVQPPYYSSVQNDLENETFIKHKPYPLAMDFGLSMDLADAGGKDPGELLIEQLGTSIYNIGTSGWKSSYALPFSRWLFSPNSNQSQIQEKMKEFFAGNTVTITADGGGQIDYAEASANNFKLAKDSPFSFPVWNYSYEDLYKISWGSLGDFQDSSNTTLNENIIASNPSAQYITDHGVPEWVRGLRIYPTLDNDTTVTKTDNSPLSNSSKTNYVPTMADLQESIDGDGISPAENNVFLTGYKSYTPGNAADVTLAQKMIPAATIVMEPKILPSAPLQQSIDFSIATEYGIDNPPESKAYVDIRYAVEIDIDERDLILDMLGQGVFSLAGELSDYEKLGFNMEKLLFKSNGNLVSQTLIEAYEDSDYTFDGVYGYDFGSFTDLVGEDLDVCPTFPSDSVNEKVAEALSNSSDPYACTSYVCLEGTNKVSEQLKVAPGKDADNVGYLKSETVVKVLKEWVNGKGEFNKVRVVDASSTLNGQEGFIDPSILRPVFPTISIDKKIFFDQVFNNQDPLKKYTLAETTVTTMGEFADLVKPDWWKDEKMRYGQPYEYVQEGEYWYTVELDYNCIVDEADLQAKIYEAKVKGVKELLNFYGKAYTEEEVQKLVDTYLAVRIDIDLEGKENGDSSRNGFHVSDRPGDPILFLVKVGGIYVNAFPDKQESLEQLKNKSTKIISLNTRWYQAHIQQAIYALNSLYYDILSSEFRVTNFNFKKETERMSFVPSYLKRILYANGYEPDYQRDDIINIGFDGQYRVTFFSYKEKDKQEKLLRVGHDYFSGQEPFVFKNTMALLYRHRQVKDPTLKSNWQKLFNQWLPDPKPQIVPKGEGAFPSDSRCKPNLTWSPPPLSQIWEQVAANLDELLDLDPRYDLGSFRFNLLEYFPPCPKPPSGRGLTVLRLLSEIEGETKVFDDLDILDSVAQEVDRIGQYVGDFMTSAQALEDIKLKIFTMDDLYSFLLNYISPELLYSKICKCFIDLLDIPDISVPNLEINATAGSGGLNLNPSQIGKDPKELYDVQGPEAETNFFEEKEVIKSEDLFCSFCFRVPSVFLRLPSTDILAELINLFKKLLEFALAQLLLQLIAALLDILLTCPDLECAPGASKVKDYGNQNLANTFNNSSPNLTDFISDCGLLIDGENITEEEVITMLQEISDKLTTSEVLGLLSGTPTKECIKVVERVVTHYPSINAVFTNIGMIEDFFMCAGDKIDLDAIEDANLENVADPLVCLNFNELSSENILDKCGSLSEQLFEAIKDRNLKHNMEKYKKIARFIRDNDDLSNQMPSLFEDGKGAQALLSSMNVGTADKMVDETIDTIAIPIASRLAAESRRLTMPAGRRLIKQNDRMSALYKMPIGSYIWSALGASNGSDDLSGLTRQVPTGENLGETELEVVQIDTLLGDVSSALQFDKENYKIGLSVPGGQEASVVLTFRPPVKDQQTQEIIYANNYEINVKSELPFYSEPIEYSVYGNLNQVPEDIEQYIQQFELQNTSVPEQAQVFGNIIVNEINNLLEQASISDSGISQQVEELKEIFEGDLYLNSVGTILDNVAEVISNGNILSSYTIDRQDELLSAPVAAQMAAIAAVTPIIGGSMISSAAAGGVVAVGVGTAIAIGYPSYEKKQLQHINFMPSYASGGSEGLINFDLVKQIVKDNYNFAKDTDQNSESIGMPQLAILNGMISAFIQVFVGEVYAKGSFTLAHYPKELFNENLNGGILSEYVAQLIIRFIQDQAWWIGPTTDWSHFLPHWSIVVTRALAEKPEFENLHPNKALPGLPGESTDKGDNIVGMTGINGKMYDVVTGKEESIQDWKDATKYFVRQNTIPPLNFVKKRLNSVDYAQDLAPDQETNPFDSLVYSQVLEVHGQLVSDFSPGEDLSQLAGEEIEEILDELPEIQQQSIEKYFSSLTESSLFMAGGNELSTSEFANGKFFYQYYFRIEDWETEEEAQENDGIYVENLVKRKVKGSAESNQDLYGVLNRASLLQVLNNMYPAGENYDLTDFQTKEPINKFFKSIKFGIRFCYGSIQSTDLLLVTQTQDTKDMNNLLNDVIKKIHQNDKGKELCRNEKILKIVELDVDKNIDAITTKQDKRISYVVPVKSKEVNIKSFDLFKLSLAEFIEEGNDTQISEWEQYKKNLFNSVFADLNGFSENSQNMEFKTLFSYCIPLPILVNMFLLYNVAIVSTDKNVHEAFDGTKAVIKDVFNFTFNVKGPNYWKDTPAAISSKGGPLGIATSAIAAMPND
jgi:hypothetical protein